MYFFNNFMYIEKKYVIIKNYNINMENHKNK